MKSCLLTMFLDLSHDQLLNNLDLPVSRFGLSHKGTSNGSEPFDSLKEQDLWSVPERPMRPPLVVSRQMIEMIYFGRQSYKVQ
jgi:hypothetical protein